MTPDRLKNYFDTSPAVKLLQADHAAYVVCFLVERFKQARAISVSHSDLLPALSSFQEDLRDRGIDALKGKPEEYLRDWSDKRWLRRNVEAGRDESMYQLTPHAEAAIDFVERALQQDLNFVGTESRLRLVMQTLEELAFKASDDPDVQLKFLRDEKARIEEEIQQIETHGARKFAPTRIREQFALAVRMLKDLQGDFRAVEEKFKEITRQVQQRQVQGLDSRGGILADALGAEDELKLQDQGVSFFEFMNFIQSPVRQDRLGEIIHQLLRMKELTDQSEGLVTIRYMVRGLLDESEKVFQTTRRLSATLRRLLDTATRDERQRVTELLRQIRVLSAGMSERPPHNVGIWIADAIEISAPMSRTNWAPPVRFEHVDLVEHATDESLRQKVFRQLFDLKPIDWNAMRTHIGLAVATAHGRCTLRQLLEDEPPLGLIDVLGYIHIACEDRHLVELDATEEIVLPDDKLGRIIVKVPLVTFIGGK